MSPDLPPDSSPSKIQEGAVPPQPAPASHVVPASADAPAENVAALYKPQETVFPEIAVTPPDIQGRATILSVPPGTSRLQRVLHIDTGKTIYSLGLSVDGRLVAAGIGPGPVRIWEAATGKVVATLAGHSDRTVAVSFSPDGSLLATGSWDGTAKLWDLTTFRERRVLGHESSVNTVVFSPDGMWLASGTRDRSIGLWRLNNLSSARQIRAHERESQALAFSPNGEMLAAASSKGTVTVWPFRSDGKPFKLEGPASGATAAAFSPDSRSLTVAGGNVIRTWDIASQHIVDQENFPAWQYQLAYGPEGHCLVVSTSGTSPREVRLRDVQASRELARLHHDHTVRWIATDPRARLIAVADDTGRVTLWRPGPQTASAGQ
jgi:WD40 repeat protein